MKHFWGNSQRTSLLSPKSDYLRKEHRNTQKICFSSHIWEVQILRKIWICLNNCFDHTSKLGEILIKTVFLSKVSHIQLNYAFLWFCSILEEIHRELLFLVKTCLSQRGILKYSESLFSLTGLKRRKSRGKFGFVSTNVFEQTSKMGHILTNCFSPQSGTHSAKPCHSVVLKHLFGNSQRTSFLVQKCLSQKRAQKYSESMFF